MNKDLRQEIEREINDSEGQSMYWCRLCDQEHYIGEKCPTLVSQEQQNNKNE